MQHRALIALAILTLAAVPHPAVAAEPLETAEYRLQVRTVAGGLDHPWALAWLPDGRMLVTERPGQLLLLPAAEPATGPATAPATPRPRITVSGLPEISAGGQGGLLDILVDPQFSTNRTVFFSYVEAGPGGRGTAVARATLEVASGAAEPGAAALSDVAVIFRQTPKARGGRHFGARLVMADDGTLFVTLGERGQDEEAQNTSVNRGQIIRIMRDGAIPADNPFAAPTAPTSSGKQARPEIWSYGHRNPQGAALHPDSRALWVHEHGPRGGDEINIPEPGGNYGWPVIGYGVHYSGLRVGVGNAAPGMMQPVHYWDPSIAPSGMAFYAGTIYPRWRGNLFVGALKARQLVRLTLDGARVAGEERMLSQLGERIRDVRVGPDGYLYLVTDSSAGRILRLEPVDP